MVGFTLEDAKTLNKLTTSLKTSQWFYAFLIIHLIVWTVLPSCVRHNLPMDSIEGSIWGHQLEWGYDKNPFMNAWLTAFAIKLGGTSGWPIYLFSQLSVVICFFAIWQLGKKMFPPIYALIGVMLLEGLQYYNVHALELNDNTLELGLWGLTILFFYQAISQETKWRDWLLTGLFAALAMMTKYFTLILLAPMLLFMLINSKAQEQFKNPAFYAALVIFFLLMVPHIAWLFNHNFLTINYALHRVSSEPTWQNHFNHPYDFAVQQFEVTLPALAIFCLFFLRTKKTNTQISTFDKIFLYFIGLGPFVFTVMLSIATGMKLRAGWGQPLLSLWILVLLMWAKPEISTKRFYGFLTVFYSIFALLIIGYCSAFITASKPSSANFPGKVIAEKLTQEWHDSYHRPLTYVAGSRWLAGNIAFYSPDRPSVYINWNKDVSFWIDEKKLKQDGAIFVWDQDEDNQLSPEEVHARFAKMGEVKIIYFTWMRNPNMKPIKVTFAILPPTA